MNILILNWRDIKNPKAGGAEIVTLEHAKAWVKSGHNVIWFTSSFPHAKQIEVIDGVTVFRRGTAYSVILFAPFFYFFSGYKFDVIIDEFHGLPYFTPIYVKKPIIAFIHEVAGEIWDYMYPFPLNILGKLLESFSFLFYRSIPFWTDAMSTIDSLEEMGISKSQCTAIPCPINVKVLKNVPKKAKKPTFIFVSRLVRMKGIEDVIKAFSIIVKEKHDAELLIIGRGEHNYTRELKSNVQKLGISKNIKFLGFVEEDEKIRLMRESHVLLHASVKEGWGLVVLEAASQGTPGIVYNVNGLRDVVLHKKTGFVLTKNVPEELAKRSLSLLKDVKQYKIFQETGMAWARSFSWKEATEKSLGLLINVTKNAR